ncbi:MAG: hypothetical protein HQL32_11810 [Planctomycetes bacterium]|nr:hypothetical protein [Planctomycetota bacterium]
MTLQSFNELQIEEIKRYKWLESEKAGKDLGEQAVIEWIELYGEKFRRDYEDMQQEGSLHLN